MEKHTSLLRIPHPRSCSTTHQRIDDQVGEEGGVLCLTHLAGVGTCGLGNFKARHVEAPALPQGTTKTLVWALSLHRGRAVHCVRFRPGALCARGAVNQPATDTNYNH